MGRARAAEIVALETKIAAAHWDVVKRRDADLTYNLRTFAELTAEAPGFDWTGWVTALGIDPDAAAEVVVRQPDYLTAFAALWAGESLDDWKDWLRWRLIHARAAVLTDDAGRRGLRLLRPHAERHRADPRPLEARRVAGGEPDGRRASDRLYVERHFPPDAKARMDELVANLREAYRVSINDLEWMTPRDPAAGAGQAGQVHRRRSAIPTKWRDYSALVIDRDDLYGNVPSRHARWHRTASSPSWAARWTATSGS